MSQQKTGMGKNGEGIVDTTGGSHLKTKRHYADLKYSVIDSIDVVLGSKS